MFVQHVTFNVKAGTLNGSKLKCVFVFQFVSSWLHFQANLLVRYIFASPIFSLFSNHHIIYQVEKSSLVISSGVLRDSQLILLYSNKEQWNALHWLLPEEER